MSVIESLGVALPNDDGLESLQALALHLFRGRCLGSRELQHLMDKLHQLIKIVKPLLPDIIDLGEELC